MAKPRDGTEPRRSSALLHSYQKALFWRRLMLAAFFTVFVATILWAVPWFPWGLNASDYNERLQFLFFLLLMETMCAFGAVYLRDVTKRVEQTLLTWTTVHDGLTDLRRREYFYDRIVIECERAKSSRTAFAVITIRIDEDKEEQPEARGVEWALAALEPMVREYDCLAALGPHEIGALAPLIGNPQAGAFADRLRQLLLTSSQAHEGTQINVGWAVYGSDATDASDLVGLARARLQRKEQTETAAQSYPAPAA